MKNKTHTHHFPLLEPVPYMYMDRSGITQHLLILLIGALFPSSPPPIPSKESLPAIFLFWCLDHNYIFWHTIQITSRRHLSQSCFCKGNQLIKIVFFIFRMICFSFWLVVCVIVGIKILRTGLPTKAFTTKDSIICFTRFKKAGFTSLFSKSLFNLL